MDKISFKDFEKQFMLPSDKWDFSLFKILCKKCNSMNVEFAGETEITNGYYGDVDFEHKIIIKCHDCGNAHAIKAKDSGNGGECDCD